MSSDDEDAEEPTLWLPRFCYNRDILVGAITLIYPEHASWPSLGPQYFFLLFALMQPLVAGFERLVRASRPPFEVSTRVARWRHEFRSAVADMTNNVKDRGNAQSACAAQFIGNHLPDGWLDNERNSWIHVDMAAPAHDKSSERATGYGVALSVC